MKSAALVRQQIEETVSNRMHGALSPRQRERPEQTACGVAGIDALLHGGLPVGSVTEFVGAECSGRTTIALAYTAAMTQAGGVCAWIDVGDTLQPESAAASGVDLERLLWIRCGPAVTELREVSSQAVPAAVVGAGMQARGAGCGSPHPRSEGKDMPQAVEAMMHAHGAGRDQQESLQQAKRMKRMIGTPGAPNRPLTERPKEREEQVNSDRMPPRRGENLAIVPRCAESVSERFAGLPLAAVAGGDSPSRKAWSLLDQGLRVTDLLLQGGGFSCIVLDLGSMPPDVAWRIPLATWFRFRAACERTRISLVLLTQHPCARSSAELVVRLQSGCMESENRVMTGIRFQAAIERNRNENRAQVVAFRKPPQAERQRKPGEWRSEAAWA